MDWVRAVKLSPAEIRQARNPHWECPFHPDATLRQWKRPGNDRHTGSCLKWEFSAEVLRDLLEDFEQAEEEG